MNPNPPTNDDVAKRAIEVINSLSSELASTYSDLGSEASHSARLLDTIEDQQKEILLLKERIKTLENTKALKLQRRYWELKKGFRLGKGQNA